MKEAGSVWKWGFVYCGAGLVLFEWDLDLFFNVLSAPHCSWLTVQVTEWLSKGSRFKCVEMYCSFSFYLATETETLCKQELLKVNIKLEKVLKAFRWLWK